MNRLIGVLLLFPTLAYADINISVLQYSRISNDSVYQVSSWNGVQINYDYGEPYVFFGYERASIIPLWGIGDMDLMGLGVGFKRKKDNLAIFGQIGYYHITHENEGRHRGYSEGLEYYFNSRYGFTTDQYYQFDEYQIDYSDTIGVTVGMEYTMPLSKNTEAGFSLGYRLMKVKELLRVMRDEWDFDGTGVCWEEGINRDYSTINAGITFTYHF